MTVKCYQNHQRIDQPSSFSLGGQHNGHFCVKDPQTDIQLLVFFVVVVLRV